MWSERVIPSSASVALSTRCGVFGLHLPHSRYLETLDVGQELIDLFSSEHPRVQSIEAAAEVSSELSPHQASVRSDFGGFLRAELSSNATLRVLRTDPPRWVSIKSLDEPGPPSRPFGSRVGHHCSQRAVLREYLDEFTHYVSGGVAARRGVRHHSSQAVRSCGFCLHLFRGALSSSSSSGVLVMFVTRLWYTSAATAGWSSHALRLEQSGCASSSSSPSGAGAFMGRRCMTPSPPL